MLLLSCMSYYFIKFLFCDINWCSFLLSEARNPDSFQGSLLNLKTLSSLGKTALLYYCSVTHLCPTLCDLMDWSTPGFSVLHCLPKFAQTHVHWVGVSIQPSHPLSSPSPALNSLPASESFPMSWLFTSSGQSIGVSASVLPMNIQRWFPLGLMGLISLLSKGLSRVFSPTV